MATAENIKPGAATDAFFNRSLADTDSAVAASIQGELGRQRHEVELIASENIVSRAVLEAQGSVMTNKYAEGYPGRRYYGGCEFVDVAEDLAIEVWRDHVAAMRNDDSSDARHGQHLCRRTTHATDSADERGGIFQA